MRAKPVIKNFLAGEIAPQLDGLMDSPAQGCKTLENFIVRKQGGVSRRPGTFYAGAVKTAGVYTRVIPFQGTDGAWYVIELGNVYARFWIVSTHLVSGGAGTETEVVTPYLTAQLRDIKYVVIKDEIYFTHPSHPVQRLTYTSSTSWAWDRAPITTASRIIAVGQKFSAWQTDSGKIVDPWERAKIPTLDFSYNNYVGIGWGAGIWLVVADDGLALSYDGEFWIELANPTTYALRGIPRFLGNLFMVPANTDRVIISSDGVSWETIDIAGANNPCNDVGYRPGTGRYVIAQNEGTAYYSDDGGNSWTVTGATQFSAGKHIEGIVYGDKWVIVGSGKTSTSTDVTGAWTGRTQAAAVGLLAVDWISELTLYVAVGASGAIHTSADAITWTARTSGVAVTLYDIAWDGSRIIVAGFDGTILTSQDGITWTADSTIGLSNDPDFRSVAIDYIEDYPAEIFNSTNHYPRACAHHEGRLILAATNNDVNKVWGSKTDEPTVFHIGALDNEAWELAIGGRRQSRILWLEGASNLVLSTDSQEGVIIGGPVGITASARFLQWHSSTGSADVQGILIGSVILFLQRNATIVRAYQYNNERQAYDPPDLTFFADHIATGGILEWDHQSTPESIIWAIRNDGTLLSLSFDPAQQIIAWARHTSGVADFESVAVVGGAAEDEVWVVVERLVNSATVRYLEYMDVRDFGAKADAHFVDCGIEQTVTGTTVTGLAHLEAETVDILVDGSTIESAVVSGAGEATLDASVTGKVVHVGLPYDSKLQTTRLRTGSPWGSEVGLKKNIPKVYAWLYETIGGKFGPLETSTQKRTLATVLQTNLYEIRMPSKFNQDGYIWVIQDDPLPMTLLGLSPEVVMGAK